MSPTTQSNEPVTRSAPRFEVTIQLSRCSVASGTDPHDQQQPSVLRRATRIRMRTWGLTDIADDAELIVGELVTNAIKYGGPSIDFGLVRTGRGIRIEVGHGTVGKPRVRNAASDEESGRGMAIVDILADDWGLGEDGKSIWCTLSQSGCRR